MVEVTVNITGATFTLTAGTFTSTGTEVFKGAIAQTLTGAVTFNKLTINNPNGLTINNDVTVNAILTFPTLTQEILLQVQITLSYQMGELLLSRVRAEDGLLVTLENIWP